MPLLQRLLAQNNALITIAPRSSPTVSAKRNIFNATGTRRPNKLNTPSGYAMSVAAEIAPPFASSAANPSISDEDQRRDRHATNSRLDSQRRLSLRRKRAFDSLAFNFKHNLQEGVRHQAVIDP